MSAEDEMLEAIQEANEEYGRNRYRQWRAKNPEFADARDVRLADERCRLDNIINKLFLYRGFVDAKQELQIRAHADELTSAFRDYAKSTEEIDKHMIPVITHATEYLEAVNAVRHNAQTRKSAITRSERDILTTKENAFRAEADKAKTYFKATGKEKALGVVLIIVGAILAIACIGLCMIGMGSDLFHNIHAKNINNFQQSIDKAVGDLIIQPKPG